MVGGGAMRGYLPPLEITQLQGIIVILLILHLYLKSMFYPLHPKLFCVLYDGP